MVARCIDRMVQTIVEHVRPQQVLLFGSWAERGHGVDNDVDLLVVVDNAVPRRETAVRIYRLLAGVGVPKSIMVVHQSDLVRYGNVPGTVVEAALSHGKTLYRAVA